MNHLDLTAARPVGDFFARSRGARWMGHGMRAAQRLSPALALRLALPVFFTPLPSKLAARSRRLPPGWRLERLPFEQGMLALWRHASAGQGRARVLLAHGWGGDAQQMLPLADALAEQGLEPVLVDFPAHGRSDGWRSSLPQFVRALFAVQARLGPWQAVVAHSLGGLAAAHAAGRGLTTQRLVLIAPPLPPARVVQGFAEVFGLHADTACRMAATIERREGVPLAHFEAAWLAEHVQQPTLVVHDGDDRTAPAAWGQTLAKALPQGQWFGTEGLGHRRLLAEHRVAQQVARFVTGS